MLNVPPMHHTCGLGISPNGRLVVLYIVGGVMFDARDYNPPVSGRFPADAQADMGAWLTDGRPPCAGERNGVL